MWSEPTYPFLPSQPETEQRIEEFFRRECSRYKSWPNKPDRIIRDWRKRFGYLPARVIDVALVEHRQSFTYGSKFPTSAAIERQFRKLVRSVFDARWAVFSSTVRKRGERFSYVTNDTRFAVAADFFGGVLSIYNAHYRDLPAFAEKVFLRYMEYVPRDHGGRLRLMSGADTAEWQEIRTIEVDLQIAVPGINPILGNDLAGLLAR